MPEASHSQQMPAELQLPPTVDHAAESSCHQADLAEQAGWY